SSGAASWSPTSPGWTTSSATPSGSHAVLTISSPSPCLSLALTTSRISLGRFPIQVLPPRPGGPSSAGSLACEFTRPLRDNLICRHLIRMSFLTDFHARNPACDLDRLVDVRLRPDEAAQLDHALERFDVDLVDLQGGVVEDRRFHLRRDHGVIDVLSGPLARLRRAASPNRSQQQEGEE